MAGTADQTVLLVPVDELHVAADNRVVGNVDDLAASIADLGVLQPLLVEPDPSGGYEVVCGARRLAAAKQAGRDRVPATVRTFADEKDKPVARACENLNREDLTPPRKRRPTSSSWPSASASTQWANPAELHLAHHSAPVAHVVPGGRRALWMWWMTGRASERSLQHKGSCP